MTKFEEQEHGIIVWARIDGIIHLILQNPRYLQRKRTGELTELVIGHIKKEYKITISERTAQRYVKEARNEIRRINARNIEKKKEMAVFARYSLIARAQKAQNLKEERLTLMDLASLEGLYPEKNIKHTGEIMLKNIDFSKLPEGLLQRIVAGEDLNKVLAEINAINTNADKSTS